MDVMKIQTKTKIIKKIPGVLALPPKTEVDGKITNLASKTIPELLELKERQLKLLNNKSFISKLPDNGAKIQTLYEKIVHELEAKQEEEKTRRLFDKLNLNVDSTKVENIEWEGKVDSKKLTYLDSDDDSDPEDVLQILSQSTAHEKKVKIIRPEKPLVTPEDLINIGETPHVKYIVGKTETNSKPQVTGLFKPYRTTRSDVHNPDKEILRKKHKNWEVTAATPPPIVHGPVKLLTLEESLKRQKDYNIHLKEIEAQHAAQKLLARSGIKMHELPKDTSKFGTYREANSDADSDESDPEGSDKEVHDDEPDRGGVVFTVMK